MVSLFVSYFVEHTFYWDCGKCRGKHNTQHNDDCMHEIETREKWEINSNARKMEAQRSPAKSEWPEIVCYLELYLITSSTFNQVLLTFISSYRILCVRKKMQFARKQPANGWREEQEGKNWRKKIKTRSLLAFCHLHNCNMYCGHVCRVNFAAFVSNLKWKHTAAAHRIHTHSIVHPGMARVMASRKRS